MSEEIVSAESQPTAPDRKKLKDMNESERKEYDRRAKRKSREKQKVERLAREIPEARDYELPEAWEAECSAFTLDAQSKIQAELGQLTGMDKYIIRGACCVVLGLDRSYIQRVQEPSGFIVAGWFPDAIASEAVEHCHRYPNLLNSPTFKKLYDQLLTKVLRWANKAERYCVTPEFLADVQAAIGGTYVLPPEPKLPEQPKPQPGPSPLEKLHGRGGMPNPTQVAYENLPRPARVFLDAARF